jgi:hypothetical protein
MTIERLRPRPTSSLRAPAKQSMSPKEELDCFVASAPRNDVDGSRHSFMFSRHAAPEVCKFVRPKKERAQGRPGARCTRGLMCTGRYKNAHEHTGSAETLRPSLRNGFTAYLVLSPARPELACHRRQRDTKYHSRLDTCHWGVRTTRFCRTLQPRSSVAALASIAPRPAFRDECAYAPLVGRDGARSEADLPSRSSATAATHWHDGQLSKMPSRFIL